jgi:hypothetical protein
MPEQRAFDFWIGDWVVTDPATGDALGESRIERILGGRSLDGRGRRQRREPQYL